MSRSYVTKLAAAGRLVLSPDGKLVDVQASIRRLDETQRAGAHAVCGTRRGNGLAQATGSAKSSPDRLREYNLARTRREQAAAEAAEIQLRKLKADLVEVSEVRAMGAKIGGLVASWFDRLGPRLGAVWAAEDDPATRERLFGAELRQIQGEWADAIMALAPPVEPSPAEAPNTLRQ